MSHFVKFSLWPDAEEFTEIDDVEFTDLKAQGLIAEEQEDEQESK